jgi:hypothetical protein
VTLPGCINLYPYNTLITYPDKPTTVLIAQPDITGALARYRYRIKASLSFRTDGNDIGKSR